MYCALARDSSSRYGETGVCVGNSTNVTDRIESPMGVIPFA